MWWLDPLGKLLHVGVTMYRRSGGVVSRKSEDENCTKPRGKCMVKRLLLIK